MVWVPFQRLAEQLSALLPTPALSICCGSEKSATHNGEENTMLLRFFAESAIIAKRPSRDRWLAQNCFPYLSLEHDFIKVGITYILMKRAGNLGRFMRQDGACALRKPTSSVHFRVEISH